MKVRAAPLGLGMMIVILAGCDGWPTGTEQERSVEYTFHSGAEGWTAGFADYPVGDEPILDLGFEHRELPAPLDTTRGALFITGSNRSDDLFMYLKRPMDGLFRGGRYRVEISVEIASSEGSGCVGIGGAPGESVFVKAGATTVEPDRVVEDGYYRMNVDKGNQSVAGESTIVLGDIANGSEECHDGEYRLKTLEKPGQALEVVADAGGRIWLLVGTDSGYEGITKLYYTTIRAELRRI